MVTHLIVDFETACGCTSLEEKLGDDYSENVCDCNCGACLSQIRNEIDNKMPQSFVDSRISKKDEEYLIIAEAVDAAMTVECMLWDELSANIELGDWQRLFTKNNAKIAKICKNNTNWRVDLKRSLLHNAALSVAMLKMLNSNHEIQPCEYEYADEIPNDIPQYDEENPVKVYAYCKGVNTPNTILEAERYKKLAEYLTHLTEDVAVADLLVAENRVELDNCMGESHYTNMLPILRVGDDFYTARELFDMNGKLDKFKVCNIVFGRPCED